MLVKFVDKENPTIILEREYPEALTLLKMIEQKAAFSLFFDSYGEKRVNGRLYDYEYIIELDESGWKNETLLVSIDCSFNNF